MRRKFFIQNLTHMLMLSLLPVILLTAVFLFVLIPSEKAALQSQSENNLSLIRENTELLLNDSSKVMNLLDATAYSNSIYRILEASQLDYLQFVTLRQVSSQLNAIVNSRDYISSIYVYLPNSKEHYVTNRGNIYSLQDKFDQNWLEACSSPNFYSLIRRQALLYPDTNTSQDYLTVIQKNTKGHVVAVNIVVSYFRRLFSELHLKEGEIILLVDDGTLLFSSDESHDFHSFLTSISAMPQSSSYAEIDGMLVSLSQSDTLNLQFISATPKSVAYMGVYRLMFIALMTIACCILISILFSIRYTINVTRQIYYILDLMEAAISNKKLPPVKHTDNSLYSHIVTNMICTFTQNDFLKVSLNEQKFRSLSMELSALQYQINPHFLSNTLQMIDFEIMRLTGRPSAANDMVQQLSMFLQYSLRSPELDVTLEQEIEATKYYSALMSKRYLNQVQIDWKADPDTLSVPIPKLIFQPLIENSIQHGLDDSDRILHIGITIRITDEQLLIIKVQDDGQGLPQEKLNQLQSSLSDFKGFNERHIGLQNLFRRLQLRFSPSQCTVILESKPHQGFTVEILIRDFL